MVKVALLGDDLLLASRVEAVARDAGCFYVRVTGGTAPAADVVFVDLNGATGTGEIAEIRGELPDAVIVGFCSHGDDQMRAQAMAAGATLCVTNGALAATARKLLVEKVVAP